MEAELEPVDSTGRRPWERRQLCRELATGDVTQAALARKYGVTRSAINNFAKRHAREIDEIKEDLDNEFAGLWIADKAKRLAAYQDLYNQAEEHENSGHHEWIKAKSAILNNVARELGQDKEAASSVQHVIVGVQVEMLQ
jgi:transposase-like protein